MSCSIASEQDLDAYLLDPRAEEFAAFRRHWPTCRHCTGTLLDASRLEAFLRAAADERGNRHPLEEMLLLHADGANELEPAARDEIARHVAGCRTCADELRALRRHDAHRAAGARLLPDDGAVAPIARDAPLLARRLRLLLAAAVVGIAVGGSLWWQSGRPAVEVAPIAETSPTPTPPRTVVEVPKASEAPAPEPAVAVAESPPPGPEASSPKPRSEASKAPPAVAVKSAAPAASPVPSPAPVEIAALDPARLPTYVAPVGARGGMRLAPSVVRSGGETPNLLALAPDHVGRTGRASPTLYFHLDRRADAPIEVTITDPDAIEPLAEFTLAPPIGAGIHAIDLARRGATLRPGVAYQWSVALVLDAEHRAGDVVAGAAIERVEAPEAKGADAFAQAGLFYDALAAVEAEIAAHPEDAQRRARRAALLEQVGLGSVGRR